MSATPLTGASWRRRQGCMQLHAAALDTAGLFAHGPSQLKSAWPFTATCPDVVQVAADLALRQANQTATLDALFEMLFRLGCLHIHALLHAYQLL